MNLQEKLKQMNLVLTDGIEADHALIRPGRGAEESRTTKEKVKFNIK